MSHMIHHLTTAALFLVLAHEVAHAADVQSQDFRAGNDNDKHYILIAPVQPKAPPAGHPLLLILPGGDGGANFNPFCQRIAENALPDGYLVAQLVSKKWNENQPIIWPTATNRVPNQKFTTDQFIEAVIKDVQAKHNLDASRIYALGWSSGGPPLYAATLKKGTPLRGVFIAMSVFNPRVLPPLDGAKGRSFYIYHSPEDTTCPMRMAEAANTELAGEGAKTTLVKYDGGHGWHGNVFKDIRDGIDWLEKQQ